MYYWCMISFIRLTWFKKILKRKWLMACYPSTCKIAWKVIWFVKKREGPTCFTGKTCDSHLYDSNLFKMYTSLYLKYLKRNEKDLRASQERPVIATSMIPISLKCIDSWTYVLYRQICNSHFYDSGLLYLFWYVDLRALQKRL